MTKKQIVWLLIRVIGLYFLWHSASMMFGIAGTSIYLSDASMVLLAVLYLALGVYCLWFGETLFYLINRESADRRDREV